MTTNITPIEALEKIEELANEIRETANAIDEENYGRLDVRIAQFAKQIKGIATQPLAPQECDVEKCEFYYINKVGKTVYQACSCYSQTNDAGYLQDTLCKDNPNCNFKKWQATEQQLHSQQKTFTEKEIQGIINDTCFQFKYLLCKQFEKEVK